MLLGCFLGPKSDFRDMAKLPSCPPSLYSPGEQCTLLILHMTRQTKDAGMPSLGIRCLACDGLLSWCGGRPRADLETQSLHGALPEHEHIVQPTLLLDPREGLSSETPESSLGRAFFDFFGRSCEKEDTGNLVA